jgi:acylglycerol lipase
MKIFFRHSILMISLLTPSIAAAASPFSYDEYNKLRSTKRPYHHLLATHDDVKLAYYPFVAEENPNGPVVVIYHGGGAYSTSAYQWVAEKLQQSGISSYCFDIRGHGSSYGPRGDAASVNAVYEDLRKIILWIRFCHPQSDIYLVGHSSGAGLLINYHNTRKDYDVAGYILLAPFLGPKSNTNRYGPGDPRSFVKKARPWVFALNAFMPVSWFSHINAVFFNYSEQLLKNDPSIVPQYSYVMSSATTPYEIDGMMSQWGLMPIWAYIGDQDEQFFPERVTKLCQKAVDLAVSPSESRVIPGAGHLSILKNAPELIAQAITNRSACVKPKRFP